MNRGTISMDAEAAFEALDNAIRTLKAGKLSGDVSDAQTELLDSGESVDSIHKRFARIADETRRRIANADKPKKTRQRKTQRAFRFSF